MKKKRKNCEERFIRIGFQGLKYIIYIGLKVKNGSQTKQIKSGRNSITKRKVNLPLVMIILLKIWTLNLNSSDQISTTSPNMFEIEL